MSNDRILVTYASQTGSTGSIWEMIWDNSVIMEQLPLDYLCWARPIFKSQHYQEVEKTALVLPNRGNGIN